MQDFAAGWLGNKKAVFCFFDMKRKIFKSVKTYSNINPKEN